MRGEAPHNAVRARLIRLCRLRPLQAQRDDFDADAGKSSDQPAGIDEQAVKRRIGIGQSYPKAPHHLPDFFASVEEG